MTARPFAAYLDPRRYLGKLYRLAYGLIAYDAASIEREEALKFERCGFELAAALAALNPLLREKIGRDFDFSRDSVHWLLFAACAVRPMRAPSILEIGTFDGEFTWLLAKLFPQSRITTVDLPESDPLMRSLYGRGDDDRYAAYLRTQQANLDLPNIEVLKVNSFFLPECAHGPFDLVWMDGGHLYPDVAWDLGHAWHLCRPGGIIFCDDVIPSRRHYRDAYVSTESFEALNYVAARSGGPLELFLKRRHPENHALKHLRKYVACLTRTALR